MENSSTNAEAQALRLENVYQQVELLIRESDPAQSLTEPSEGEWSGMQILGHITEMIPYWLDHCRSLIATLGDMPRFGRRLDARERLDGVERGTRCSRDQMLASLREEIRSAAVAIRSMSPAERSRKGVHIRRGEITVGEVVEVFIVAHAEEHVRQLAAALGSQAGAASGC